VNDDGAAAVAPEEPVNPELTALLQSPSTKAARLILFGPIERITHRSLDAYLTHLMFAEPHRRRVVDDLSGIFHAYLHGIPASCRQVLARALLQGSSDEIAAAAVILLEHVFHLYFNDLSSPVRAHFTFVFVCEKDSASLGLKQGVRRPASIADQLVDKPFLTWKEQTAIIGASRARVVIQGFEDAFNNFSTIAQKLDVDLTTIVLPGGYEGDQAQMYIALNDGAAGAFTTVVSVDRDVVSAATDMFANATLATARQHRKAIIQTSRNAATNTKRYEAAARKLRKRLVKVEARLQEAETEARAAATVSYDGVFFLMSTLFFYHNQLNHST
jgi:hypothetical protein